MGLSIVPVRDEDAESISFSYRGFNEFRAQLARAIGYELRQMEGFGGEEPWPSPIGEPLVYLLHHSDCDGSLGYEECSLLADRLREVAAEAFPDSDDEDPLVSSGAYRRNAFALADLCAAVARGDYRELVFT